MDKLLQLGGVKLAEQDKPPTKCRDLVGLNIWLEFRPQQQNDIFCLVVENKGNPQKAKNGGELVLKKS